MNKPKAIEYVIRATEDGKVTIVGPIDNFVLFRDVMNSAERAVLQRISKAVESKPEIIVPNVVIPRDLKRLN